MLGNEVRNPALRGGKRLPPNLREGFGIVFDPTQARAPYFTPAKFLIVVYMWPRGNMHAKRNSAIFHLREEPFITPTVKSLRLLPGEARNLKNLICLAVQD